MTAFKKLFCIFTAALILTLASAAQAGKVYLWYTTDASGKRIPNYGEKPPLGVDATLISDSPSSRPNVASSPASNASAPDAPEKKTNDALDKELAAKQRALQADRQQECDSERRRLTTLRSSTSRIRTTGDDGQLRYLSPAEIAEEIRLSQNFIDQACSG